MSEVLNDFFRSTLPDELASLLKDSLAQLEDGDYIRLLQSSEAQSLLGRSSLSLAKDIQLKDFSTWNDYVFDRLGSLLGDRSQDEDSGIQSSAYKQNLYFLIGYAAFLAFLQSNVTGPPLPFLSSEVLFPADVSSNDNRVAVTRRKLIESLSIDGVSAYRLTPNIELLCLADAIMTSPPIIKNIPAARWAKLRILFTHQRLLSEVSPSLQNQIYDDLDLTEELIASNTAESTDTKAQFLLEKATIDTFHGFDKTARQGLEEAAKQRQFEFALTGILGKRTKFQEKETSQLVVLARSAGKRASTENGVTARSEDDSKSNGVSSAPKALDLDDDTLLEAISFNGKPASSIDVQQLSSLPPSLADLDPSQQPLLDPLDSVALLSLASSITNTSPADGLTREETLPYAVRVLEGGSSNWQIYTQALLVRSRIEGYKSRTVERGLLQLQALVDQVIADTYSPNKESTTTSFLPKANEKDAAPASERLRYIFQLASPSRWDLEAELAARWVQMGGLRSALEIYERLEMWAEAALCWAATEQEDKARKIVRRQLFHSTSGAIEQEGVAVDDEETWQGAERMPPPADAPRLYCILGDMASDTAMYEKAWEVSGQRYARAQRALGRFHFSANDYVKAAEAYSKSLRANGLNQSSWFALGCALLELAQFPKAVQAFTRCVQLDEQDAESWSNLAAALLKQDAIDEPALSTDRSGPKLEDEEDDEGGEVQKVDPTRNRKDALRALKRAASLKHDSYRIWENVLIVAASVSPPDYTSILSAQRQIIRIRGNAVGEKCIDVDILQLLVRHIITSADTYDANKPGFERMLVDTMDKQIVPLITASRPLWQIVAKLAIWRNKPASALEAHEKAWRAVTSQPGWDTDSETRWNEVADATVELCDAYESLGPREKNEGLGAGEGVLVAKDWRFKARTAVRGIMSRAKASWEDTDAWSRLQDALNGLKA